MNELLKEIFSSMRQNRLRTALTGFSIAWGIFMLVILLGSGNGLENGMNSNFSKINVNTITIYPKSTQLPYRGYNKNRKIKFKYEDAEYLKNNVDNIKNISSQRSSYGTIIYNGQNVQGNINGVTPLLYKLKAATIIKGRFINDTDIIQNRKVATISKYMAESLFDNKDPINKLITIEKINYVVVGVLESEYDFSPTAYIPITTSLLFYSVMFADEVSEFVIETEGVDSGEHSEQIVTQIREALATKYSFSKDDNGAIGVWNSIENFMQIQLVFLAITLFIWIIGIGTLMAGIVGVSNIMLVTVRERTNEFGIRKSMGATPGSIVRMVLIEAVAITMMFGYIGMFAGIFTMEVVNFYMKEFLTESGGVSVFMNPTVDLKIAIYATTVLIVAGAISGYIPARLAAKLKTIDAMRYNK